MASDESDDEPLSNLAAAKKLNPEKFVDIIIPQTDNIVVPKKKRKQIKKLAVTIKLSRPTKKAPPPEIQRPADVWLYLKDLNPTGPYSCLLCPEWFINRSKLIVHYILNHKKDFCGICRYFVADRESWWEHSKFHIPWPCSQCIENFPTEAGLRVHLSQVHKLVHCRLCHFRLPDDDQYTTHLFQKHNVTNVSSKDEDTLWEIDYEGCSKFFCSLCSKSNNLTNMFFNHYMGYHHFTLKCFSNIISGRDPPFSVNGADISSQFIDGQLREHLRIGYIAAEKKSEPNQESETNNGEENIMNNLTTEIKQETASETEDSKGEKNDENSESVNDITKTYDGETDFDVTLMELIVLQRCYFEYVNKTLSSIMLNAVPESSDINYDTVKSDLSREVDCSLCQTQHLSLQPFTSHMSKMHSVKSVPIYSCRICATTFDTLAELEGHIEKELKDFDDLWLCQFCDKEFDNRQSSRSHLTEHWELLEFDNCFSPHLGFKCKYCPTLFWNETDRETHQVRVHMSKYMEHFYKCEACSEIYSDKIWFTHHYIQKHIEDNQKTTYLLKCCLCCIVLPTVDEMRQHFDANHPEARKIFCSLDSCQYKPLSHKKSFKLHLKTIHGPDGRLDRPVSCALCAREFTSSRALSAHMAQVHGPGKFKCKICKEVLHTLDERKLHYLIRHPGRHPYECTDCGKSFQYKSSLYMHKQEHLPNKQDYTCNYCGKVFQKKDSFREHVLIHEGPRHACSYCPMRFVQRSNMLRHERRHTGERPYACTQCPRTFSDKGACTAHSRTHSKDRSYACLYCGQTFVQKSKLTYHIRKHTGENLETCTVCSKLFTSACSLREHMKIHLNKKDSVKCPLCERTYQDERYMLRHLRTSHTRNHFSCPLCNKTLTSAAGLRHHVVTHSSMNTFRCKICPKSYAVKRTIIKHLRKRHGLKGNEINIKDFYKRLEPRECDLGLDEEVMTSIFGPPKKTVNDLLIGDFVTFPARLDFQNQQQKQQKKQKNAQEEENQEDDEEDEEDGDPNEDEVDSSDKDELIEMPIESEREGKVQDINHIQIKMETKSDSENELEPTDFVSVKIEPMDEDEQI